jgi:hydroxyethylthiazole kinase
MPSRKIDKTAATAIATAIDGLRANRPLVHCITNYVTVNDCANALLAVGGSPVMADDESEAAEIAALAGALVINIGTLNARTVRSMEIAGTEAARRGIPVVLDPVGVGASRLRTETALSLLGKIPFAVIRGNASEIRVLATGTGSTRGVDATEEDSSSMTGIRKAAEAFARKTGAVVAITGATDVVTDGARTLAVANGHPLMGEITGSGCMLSAVIGAYAGSAASAARAENPSRDARFLEATAAALCGMGIAGERAAKRARRVGTGSFRAALIDALSGLDSRTVYRGMKIDAL